MPLEIQHELLRFSRLDTTKLLSDPSQQLAYGYVTGNALAWSDQMGLGLFKKRTAEEKAQRKRNRQYSKAMKKTQRAYKKQIGKNQTRKEKRKRFSNGIKNFAGKIGNVGSQVVRKAMASPNTLVGTVALAGAKVMEAGFKLFGQNMSAPDKFKSYYGYQNSAFEFGVLLPFGQGSAISLGNIHIYNTSTPDDYTNSYNGRNQTLGVHEGAHTTEQAESFPLGPVYLIRHLLNGVGSDNNHLEHEAADFAADKYFKK